ncbi:hypothetical protein CRM22_003605, partial [Opisthorchis felineus]
ITSSERLFVYVWRQSILGTVHEAGINFDKSQEMEMASTTEGEMEVDVTANTTFAIIMCDELSSYQSFLVV